VISNMFTGHRRPGARARARHGGRELDPVPTSSPIQKEARRGVVPVHLFDPSAEQPVTWHGSHFVAHPVRELIAIVKRGVCGMGVGKWVVRVPGEAVEQL